MSELKVIDLGNIRESIEKGKSVYYEYYPKSEADKVIADLEESHKMEVEQLLIEIVELKEKLVEQATLRAWAELQLRRQKYKRCLLYAKNHKNLGDLATDTARLIGLNAYAFTKETETACVAYWNRIRDCHYRRHDEWLELAEKFKENV